MRSDGAGAAMQITQSGGYEAFESLDGKMLYFAKSYEMPEVWSVPPNGGEERLVVRGAAVGYWSVSSRGIHFVDRQPGVPVQTIKLFEFSTGQVTDTGTIEAPDITFGFSVSRDGRSMLWWQLDRDTSDIMKIDNFR